MITVEIITTENDTVTINVDHIVSFRQWSRDSLEIQVVTGVCFLTNVTYDSFRTLIGLKSGA